MCVHASSFVLYLAAIALNGFLNIFDIHDTSRKRFQIAEWATILFILASTVSQVLLCVIFWSLGRARIMENVDVTMSTEPECEEFNEDDEL
jgi:hypothetical protein